MKIKDQKVAVLIPANNEKSVIAETLSSILKMVPSKDIYVIDDGSKDGTAEVSRKFTRNVLVTENRGKASALNYGVSHFKIVKKYKFILFMDADSRPLPDFLNKTLIHFKKKDVICVSGRIKGLGKSWISKFRQWEYQIAFNIHKKAQETLSSILVTPGCATIYRASIFEKNKFPTGTLTEDMDFTFQMHRKGFSRMIFENKAIVYTQDPQTISDFTKQLSRWYTGFWQVVRRHEIPWKGQMLDFEVLMLAVEGLYNGILVIFFIVSVVNLSIFGGINILLLPLAIDFFIFFIPSLIWSSFSDKDYTRILYFPLFYFLRFLSSIIFIKSFFEGFLSEETVYVWNSTRYSGRGVV